MKKTPLNRGVFNYYLSISNLPCGKTLFNVLISNTERAQFNAWNTKVIGNNNILSAKT